MSLLIRSISQEGIGRHCLIPLTTKPSIKLNNLSAFDHKCAERPLGGWRSRSCSSRLTGGALLYRRAWGGNSGWGFCDGFIWGILTGGLHAVDERPADLPGLPVITAAVCEGINSNAHINTQPVIHREANVRARPKMNKTMQKCWHILTTCKHYTSHLSSSQMCDDDKLDRLVLYERLRSYFHAFISPSGFSPPVSLQSAQLYKVTTENYHKAADQVNAKFR